MKWIPYQRSIFNWVLFAKVLYKHINAFTLVEDLLLPIIISLCSKLIHAATFSGNHFWMKYLSLFNYSILFAMWLNEVLHNAQLKKICLNLIVSWFFTLCNYIVYNIHIIFQALCSNIGKYGVTIYAFIFPKPSISLFVCFSKSC